jgi:hypothetical protein
MASASHEILSIVDGFKDKLSDGEYLALCNTLQKLNDEPDNTTRYHEVLYIDTVIENNNDDDENAEGGIYGHSIHHKIRKVIVSFQKPQAEIDEWKRCIDNTGFVRLDAIRVNGIDDARLIKRHDQCECTKCDLCDCIKIIEINIPLATVIRITDL